MVFDNLTWHGGEKGGIDETEHKEYLKQFGSSFKEKVKMLIDRVGTL